MNRNTNITIGGRVYPARFGIQASKAISERFGSLEQMADRLQSDSTVTEKMDDIMYVLEAVIRQGCSYKNMFEADLPKIENAVIDENGQYMPITKEELEVGIAIDEFADLTRSIFDLVGRGTQQTVETEAKNTNAE